jgi:hypothetical protein
VACVFCASGLFGVKRNLTAGEIVEQFLHARRRLPAGRDVTNLVVMGMGEPMLNLVHLLPALERITDPPPRGIGFSPRRVTVSTSGYPERIDELARTGRPYHLAISLHAADDDSAPPAGADGQGRRRGPGRCGSSLPRADRTRRDVRGRAAGRLQRPAHGPRGRWSRCSRASAAPST